MCFALYSIVRRGYQTGAGARGAAVSIGASFCAALLQRCDATRRLCFWSKRCVLFVNCFSLSSLWARLRRRRRRRRQLRRRLQPGNGNGNGNGSDSGPTAPRLPFVEAAHPHEMCATCFNFLHRPLGVFFLLLRCVRFVSMQLPTAWHEIVATKIFATHARFMTRGVNQVGNLRKCSLNSCRCCFFFASHWRMQISGGSLCSACHPLWQVVPATLQNFPPSVRAQIWIFIILHCLRFPSRFSFSFSFHFPLSSVLCPPTPS